MAKAKQNMNFKIQMLVGKDITKRPYKNHRNLGENLLYLFPRKFEIIISTELENPTVSLDSFLIKAEEKTLCVIMS